MKMTGFLRIYLISLNLFLFVPLLCAWGGEKGTPLEEACDYALEYFREGMFSKCIEAHKRAEGLLARLGEGEKAGLLEIYQHALFASAYSFWMIRELDTAYSLFERYEKGGGILSDYARYFRGCIRFQEREFDLVPPIFQGFEEDFPDSVFRVDSRFLSGKALFLAGNEAGAIPFLDEVARSDADPDIRIEAKLLLLKALLKGEKRERAIPLFEEMWVKHPAHEVAAELENILKEIEKKGWYDGPSPEKAFLRAKNLFRAGRVDRAVREMRLLKESLPPQGVPVTLEYYLALSHFLKKDYEKGEKELFLYSRKGKDKNFSARALYYAALSRARQDRFAEAREFYRRCIREFPGTKAARDSAFKLAYTAFWDGKYEASLAEFSYYYERYRKGGRGDDSLWYMGLCNYKLERFDRSRDSFIRIGKEFPSSSLVPGALYWAGNVSLKMGDEKGGETFFREVIERYPLSFYSLLAATIVPVDGKRYSAWLVKGGEDLDSLAEEGILRRPYLLYLLGFNDMAFWEVERIQRGGINEDTARKLTLFCHLTGDDYRSIRSAYRFFSRFLNRPDPKERGYISLFYPMGFMDSIRKEVIKKGIEEALIYAVIREESLFKRDAVSRSDARGLMQIIPRTGLYLARRMGLSGFTDEDLFNEEMNIAFGTSYLKELMEEFNGVLPLVIAAYNAGEGKVREWVRKNGSMELDEFIESIPYSETRRYVRRVLESYNAYRILYGGWENPHGIDPSKKISKLLSEGR